MFNLLIATKIKQKASISNYNCHLSFVTPILKLDDHYQT